MVALLLAASRGNCYKEHLGRGHQAPGLERPQRPKLGAGAGPMVGTERTAMRSVQERWGGVRLRDK